MAQFKAGQVLSCKNRGVRHKRKYILVLRFLGDGADGSVGIYGVRFVADNKEKMYSRWTVEQNYELAPNTVQVLYGKT